MLQSLNEALFEKMNASLKTALLKSGARAIYLTDRGGNLIVQHTNRAIPLEDNLVALIAGAFFASQQAARILGESEFDAMTEKGKNTSLYVSSLEGDHLIIVIFGEETNPGLVKLFVNESSRTINPLIQQMLNSDTPAPAQKFEVDFTRPAFQRVG
jgi:predicted regulator of Ras-like GTPase activity (Roadblock/LC7/MglB family)